MFLISIFRKYILKTFFIFTLVTTNVRDPPPHVLVDLPDPICQDIWQVSLTEFPDECKIGEKLLLVHAVYHTFPLIKSAVYTPSIELCLWNLWNGSHVARPPTRGKNNTTGKGGIVKSSYPTWRTLQNGTRRETCIATTPAQKERKRLLQLNHFKTILKCFTQGL